MPENFDVNRALVLDEPFVPTLHNPTLIPLTEAISNQQIHPSDRCLVTTIEDTPLVVDLLPMAYYHTVQGTLNDTPWLFSFCLICNAGSCFSPIIDGKPYQFMATGVYNGMTLLQDEETKSIWHHMTGTCLHGELNGKTLPLLQMLRHMTIEQAHTAYPDAVLMQTPLPEPIQAIRGEITKLHNDPTLMFDAETEATIGQEDGRLPRLEAGIGVITPAQKRFYPIRWLNMADNFVIDTMNDRHLLVYICPTTGDPHAYYVDAESAEWRGEVLKLDNGDTLQDAVLYDPDGNLKPIEQPLQHYQRWYSFAFTFPYGDIYQA